MGLILGLVLGLILAVSARLTASSFPAAVILAEIAALHPEIYFACKALNYRTYASKYDGNRPLAVQVDWKVDDGKLVSDIIYEYPLEKNGTEMADRLLNCLRHLSIETTDDIDEDNADMSHVYE